MKQILGMILLTILLLISGCGGGGSSSGAIPGVSGTVISGTVAKGLFRSGTVRCYFVTNGIASHQVSANIHSNGSYSLNIGSYTGVVLLAVSDGTYNNEVTGTVVPLANELRAAMVVTVPGSRIACITPLTELAVRKSVANGGLTTANVNAANALISDIFPFDILATRPVPPLSINLGSASSDQQCYTMVLAGISKYGLSSFLNDFAADLSGDNYITVQNYTALNTATQDFLNDNVHNLTGYVSISDIPKFGNVGWYSTLVTITASKLGGASLNYANTVQFSLKLNTNGNEIFSIDEDPASLTRVPEPTVVTLSRYDSVGTSYSAGISQDNSVPPLTLLNVAAIYLYGITPGEIATIRLKTKPGTIPGPLDLSVTDAFATIDDANSTDSLWSINWNYLQP